MLSLAILDIIFTLFLVRIIAGFVLHAVHSKCAERWSRQPAGCTQRVGCGRRSFQRNPFPFVVPFHLEFIDIQPASGVQQQVSQEPTTTFSHEQPPKEKPAVEPVHSLTENGTQYELAVEVPGFKRDQLTLTVTDDTRQVTVSGQSGQKHIHLKVSVPRLGNLHQISATAVDGILTVRIPKLERDGRIVPVEDRVEGAPAPVPVASSSMVGKGVVNSQSDSGFEVVV